MVSLSHLPFLPVIIFTQLGSSSNNALLINEYFNHHERRRFLSLMVLLQSSCTSCGVCERKIVIARFAWIPSARKAWKENERLTHESTVCRFYELRHHLSVRLTWSMCDQSLSAVGRRQNGLWHSGVPSYCVLNTHLDKNG